MSAVECDHTIGVWADAFEVNIMLECERDLHKASESTMFFKYCPDCGAKLEGEG